MSSAGTTTYGGAPSTSAGKAPGSGTTSQPQGPLNLGALLQGWGSGLTSMFSMIPGPLGDFFRNFQASPAGQSALLQSEGRRLTEVLSQPGVKPQYQTPNLTGSLVNIPGGPPVSLPSIGAQGISERRRAFSEMQQLGREQTAETGAARGRLGELESQGDQLMKELGGLSPKVSQIYDTALAKIKGMGKTVNTYIQAGVTSAVKFYNEVKKDQANIRENFTNEVTGRMQDLATGIDAQAKNGFNEHVRSLEASGVQFSGEEREALRMVYARDGARSKASTLGKLFEVTSEVRANLDANLNYSLERASSTAAGQIGNLMQAGINSTVAAEQLAADLSKAKANSLESIASTRVQLQQINGVISLEGRSRIFQMVTDTVRPVLVFSDILSDMFAMGWDVLEYSNNIQTQVLANEAAIQQPYHQSAFDAYGVTERNRQWEQQKSENKRNRNASLWGAGISAVGTAAGGALG